VIAFDTTFLVDYLDGEAATRRFVQEQDRGAWFAPTLALFEVYRGARRSAGADGMTEAADALEWIEPLPLTDDAGREAAAIEDELLAAGEPINLGDLLIAGICRAVGARLVTRDNDFERVDDLEVVTY
jgi:predicted nucleic acid-binding protein